MNVKSHTMKHLIYIKVITISIIGFTLLNSNKIKTDIKNKN